MSSDPFHELELAVADLQTLIKTPEVMASLSERGVNISLALIIGDAWVSYLNGDKSAAIEDLETAAEEIRARGVTGTSSNKLLS